MTENLNLKEILAGAVFVALGAWFGLEAWFKLPIGTAFSMGPGYFPFVLGGLLVVLGIAVAARGLVAAAGDGLGTFPWRGIVFITAAPIIFGLTARGLGMLLSLFVTTFVAAFASRRMTPLYAVLLAAGLAVFCVGIFIYLMDLPIPVVGRWITDLLSRGPQ